MEDLFLSAENVGGIEVFFKKGMEDSVPDALKRNFAEGNLAVIYDENVSTLADKLIRYLKKAGYKIFKSSVASKRHKTEVNVDVPEYIRYVFAVGAGTAAYYAKRIAKRLNVDWSLFLTAPSTDTIATDYPPKSILIDENVLVKCPKCCLAAGYGIILSQPLKTFEDFFRSKILSEKTEETKISEVSDIKALTLNLISLSLDKRRDSADDVADILYFKALKDGKKPRLIGEYKFLASAVLTTFYSSFLAAPSIDVTPPPNIEEARDRLKELNLPSASLKSLDFFDINAYFKISYVVGEYRTDLLEKLRGVDFHKSQRFWRRLYADAGYSLRSDVSVKDLIYALTLAGAENDNLLGYAYAVGVL